MGIEFRVEFDRQMQLRHLEMFVAIAESGTLSAAARRLHKTQGSVSQDLKGLERELGVQLVDRTGQRAILTRFGELFLSHARELLHRVDEMTMEIRRLEAGEEAPIALGVLPSLGLQLADLIVRYKARVPDVRFLIYGDLEGSMIDALRTRRIDIGVGNPVLEEGINSSVVASEAIIAVVKSTDPLAKRNFVTPGDLVDRPVVGFIRHLRASTRALEFFRTIGKYPDPVIEVADFRIMLSLIAHGVGVGLMPAPCVTGGGDVVGVPTKPEIERQIAILTRDEDAQSQRLREFNEYLAEHWT